MTEDLPLRNIAKRVSAWVEALLMAVAAPVLLLPGEDTRRLVPVRIASRRPDCQASFRRRSQ